jgi:hypothetical protein
MSGDTIFVLPYRGHNFVYRPWSQSCLSTSFYCYAMVTILFIDMFALPYRGHNLVYRHVCIAISWSKSGHNVIYRHICIAMSWSKSCLSTCLHCHTVATILFIDMIVLPYCGHNLVYRHDWSKSCSSTCLHCLPWS